MIPIECVRATGGSPHLVEVQSGVPAPSDMVSIAKDSATLVFLAVFGGYMAIYPLLIFFACNRKEEPTG